MSNRVELQVHLAFDAEAKVWYVAKTEIPGLSLESESPIDLLNRIVECAPELIELNSGKYAEIMAVRPAAKRKRAGSAKADPSPIAVRPIFDAPLSLALA
ncbi:MAG: DUF1902 domain-containing protein [Erythrobacter sp.]|jgi:hypothetical protein